MALSRSRATRIGTDGKTVRTRPASSRFPRRPGSPQEPRHAPACGGTIAATNVLERRRAGQSASALSKRALGLLPSPWGCGVSDVSAGLGRRALLACSSKRWTGAQHRPRRTKMAGPARPVWGGRTRPLREDTPYRPCIDTTHLFGGAHPSNGTFFAKGTREQRHPERCPTPTRLFHRKTLFCLMHSQAPSGRLPGLARRPSRTAGDGTLPACRRGSPSRDPPGYRRPSPCCGKASRSHLPG